MHLLTAGNHSHGKHLLMKKNTTLSIIVNWSDFLRNSLEIQNLEQS
jgi:hypothetical protein